MNILNSEETGRGVLMLILSFSSSEAAVGSGSPHARTRTIMIKRWTGDAVAGVKLESATPSFRLFVIELLLTGFLRARLNEAALGPKQG
jgi:hypothetical protein